MSSVRAVVAAVVVAGLTSFASACASGGASAKPAPSAASTSASSAIAGAIDAATAPFVASRKSKKFYPSSCQTVKLIKAADQVGFATAADAEKAGFEKDLYSSDCRY